LLYKRKEETFDINQIKDKKIDDLNEELAKLYQKYVDYPKSSQFV